MPLAMFLQRREMALNGVLQLRGETCMDSHFQSQSDHLYPSSSNHKPGPSSNKEPIIDIHATQIYSK